MREGGRVRWTYKGMEAKDREGQTNTAKREMGRAQGRRDTRKKGRNDKGNTEKYIQCLAKRDKQKNIE